MRRLSIKNAGTPELQGSRCSVRPLHPWRLAGLCRRGLVKLESMEDDKLLVSVTYDGAASKPGGASAIETLK